MRPGSAFTRRGFFCIPAASWLRAEQPKNIMFPSDWGRFSDPATELETVRLTDPAYASYLPAYYQRVVSKRGNFLLFCSDRSGSQQVFRMDLNSGEYRQLTEAAALDVSSVTLVGDERTFCFFDGSSLFQTNLTSLRKREIYRVPPGWQRCAGASTTEDGGSALFGEIRADSSRLRVVPLSRGEAASIVEAPWPIDHPVGRPKRAQVLYRQGNQDLWLVDAAGRQKRKLKLADGGVGPVRWSSDGRTILYLSYPSDPRRLNAIREHTPDLNLDKLVAETSQFVHFDCNRNTSVFVGASRNRAAPHVLLLLRLTRRELTLCEHRASDPAAVAPIFSPDSQKVFFQSDKNGKPAIYRMQVDKLVEKTDA